MNHSRNDGSRSDIESNHSDRSNVHQSLLICPGSYIHFVPEGIGPGNRQLGREELDGFLVILCKFRMSLFACQMQICKVLAFVQERDAQKGLHHRIAFWSPRIGTSGHIGNSQRSSGNICRGNLATNPLPFGEA